MENKIPQVTFEINTPSPIRAADGALLILRMDRQTITQLCHLLGDNLGEDYIEWCVFGKLTQGPGSTDKGSSNPD